MFAIDIPTLATLALFGNLVYVLCAAWAGRLLPEEPCLKSWAVTFTLFTLSSLELVLRYGLHSDWSAPFGNALAGAALCWVMISLRRLIQLPVHPMEHSLPWLSAAIMLLACGWFTVLQPSFNSRVAIISLSYAVWYLVFAWTLQQHRCQQKKWLQLTILVILTGSVLFLVRAMLAWLAPESLPLSRTTTLFIAAPTFYTLLFNVWISITMILLVAQRMRQSTIEALEINRDVFSHSPLAMALYQADGSCTLVNQAYAELLAEEQTALMQHPLQTLPYWQHTGLLAACQQALSDQQDSQIEFCGYTAEQREIWLNCRIHPLQVQGCKQLLLQFTDLTEHKRLEGQLRQLAFHDPLTALPNRRLLHDRIEQAQRLTERHKSFGALLFIDLDKFKLLNDTYGHAQGDRLLIQLAQKLSQSVRKSDTVARLGGDEFVVMLNELARNRQLALIRARSMAHKIQLAICCNYHLDKLLVYPASASIGIHLFSGTEETPEQLLQDADSAMYACKMNRKIPVRVEDLSEGLQPPE